MTTGAQLIVADLEGAGVEVCFGLPGVHNLALWEALRDSPIRLVGVRHEQAAAYAADGYARATGRLGVALVTTGPGAANTLGAVGEAFASRSPVLVIATDIATTLRRPGVYRGALHETPDQAAMFAPVTVSAQTAQTAADVGPVLVRAILAATGRGPAYAGIPTDLLRAPAGRPFAWTSGGTTPPVLPGKGEAARASELMAAAERPLIWAGGGAVDRGDEVAALAEALAAPVLTTPRARGILPPRHPCRVGMPADVEPAGRLWDEADLVIAFGSDLDGMTTQSWALPQPPALIAVNADPDDAAKAYRPDVVLPALEPPAPRGGLDELAQRLRRVRAEACRQLDDRALRFLDAVSFALPDDAVVVCDMCVPGYWLGAFHTVARPRGLQYPVGWGTLGYAFPAALGAALAPGGPVVSFSGDGGFLYAAGELATLAQEEIPLTAVIVDDGGYGMLRYDQDLAGAPRHGVDLRSPDFEALAAAFGVRAETVEGLEDDFGEALARHVTDPGPSVLVARAEALTPPPTTTPNWYRRQ